VVSGPGDTGDGQPQSATALDAAWTHQFRSGSTFSFDAYSQVQSGQLIGALIQEPVSYYIAAGPGYLEQLYAAYRSPGVCGITAATPAVYAQESVAGTRRLYQGFDVTGRFALSRFVDVMPSYSVNEAVLTAAGPRLSDGPSTTIVGAQLPNRPMHRGGVTIDALLPRSGLEVLANAQYTGTNNQQNLGPYVNVSLGASHKLGPGELTLFENNVFDTYGGDFATDALSLPQPLSGGGALLTAATPLLPRSIFLSYATAIGGPAPGPAFSRLTHGAQVAALQATPSPNASQAPRRQRFTSNPPPPGVDPLSMASARASCDADAQSAAKPVYDALRAYVTAYEAHTTLPTVPNMTIVAHKVTADPTVSYYLELRPDLPRPPGSGQNGNGPGGGFGRRGGFGGGPPGGVPPGGGTGGGPPGGPGGPGGDVTAQSAPAPERSPQDEAARRAFLDSPAIKAFRGFIGCAYVTILSTGDAKAKGIETEGARFGLIYVPNVGIAFVQPQQLPQGGGSLRRDASPAPSASPAPAPAPSH
jgi:hypothetical protein